MELFADTLAKAHQRVKNHMCIGIDPHIGKVSGSFFERELQERGVSEFMLAMGRQLIAIASESGIASVKLQSAFFEAEGEPGYGALKRLIAEAKQQGLLTILDVKRGDISSTMYAYGQACFAELGADAITVLPYMGLDTVTALRPWLQQGKGVYVVWISSNPGSDWLQEPVASLVLDKLQQWLGETGLTGSCGLVLGATKAETIPEELFARALGFPLLLPGVGAQGASPGPRIKDLSQTAPSHVIPVSRGISLFGLPGAEQELQVCRSWEDYRAACGRRVSTMLALLGS